MRINSQHGFTLLEILIALFIFTILAMMMTRGLHTVIDAQSGTERHAERLRELQLVLIRLSRDVEQVVNRPIKTSDGQDASAFYGTARGFVFTHGGLSSQQQQSLQRTQYIWTQGGFWRMVWSVLDQAAKSPPPSQRLLIADVIDAKFEYLDDKKSFHYDWPPSGKSNAPIPRALRIHLTIKDWGTFTQTYVIPAENVVNNNPATTQTHEAPQTTPPAK